MALLVIICKVNLGWKLQRTEPFHYVWAGLMEVDGKRRGQSIHQAMQANAIYNEQKQLICLAQR